MIPPSLANWFVSLDGCKCAYCETARIQLADAREALSVADKAMSEALNAWRLYLDMSDDATEAHQEPLA